MAKKANLNPEIEKKNQALSVLKIEYVPANSIGPNDYNPNRQSDNDFYLLVSSMTEDGFTQPIIALKEKRQIVDGEHRWTCAIVKGFIEKYGVQVNVKNKNIGGELEKVMATGLIKTWPEGMTQGAVKDGRELVKLIRYNRLNIIDPELTIPVVFVDMTPEQARIATLRHNRARGSEDVELAAQLLKDLASLGAAEWAQDSLMLDDAEMNVLLNDIKAPEALAAEQFGEAWQPSNAMSAGASKDGKAGESMTPEAIEQMRQQELRIKAAKTEEERVAATKDTDIYRQSFIFSGEEARVVKAALGANPAQTLLAWCRAATQAAAPAEQSASETA